MVVWGIYVKFQEVNFMVELMCFCVNGKEEWEYGKIPL